MFWLANWVCAGVLLVGKCLGEDELEARTITRESEEDIPPTSVEYVGILTPQCILNYQRIFVTKTVPPRHYQYFHEVELTRAALPFRWRIVGGKEVSISSVPFQVLYGMYCGGSLINPSWVLTAAHCQEKEKYVHAGSTKRSLASKYRICAHFTHPLYGKTGLHSQDYDYLLLLLETPVPVTPNTRPIAIGDIEDIVPGAMVSVSGWGYTKHKAKKMQENLRRVYVPVMEQEECSSMPSPVYKNITSRMFCAGYINGTKDACQGDSGGPAVINGKLVGSVSFGVDCAAKDKPGVYASVPYIRNWIREITMLPL